MPKLLRLSPYPLLVFLAVVIAQIINFRLGPQPWTGDALFIASWAWTAHFLISALVTAFAALFAGQTLWDSGASLWRTPAYRGSILRRGWLAFTVAGVVPTLVAESVALSTVRYASGETMLSVLLVNVTGVASVALLVIIGFALGIRWGSTVGTLIGFAAAVVLQLASYVSHLPVLMLGGATTPLVGMRISTGFAVLLCLSLALGIAGTAMLVFRSAPRGLDWKKLSLGAGAGAAITGLLLPAVLAPSIYAPASDPLDGLGCVDLSAESAINAGEGVTGTVCTLAAHQQITDHVATQWMTLRGQAHAAGITAFPEGFVEVTSGLRYTDIEGLEPGKDAMFSLGPDEMVDPTGSITQEWILQRAFYPYWCEELWAEDAPPDTLFDTQEHAQETFLAAVAEEDPTARAALAAEFDETMASLRNCGA